MYKHKVATLEAVELHTHNLTQVKLFSSWQNYRTKIVHLFNNIPHISHLILK